MKRIFSKKNYVASLKEMVQHTQQFHYITGITKLICTKCNRPMGEHGEMSNQFGVFQKFCPNTKFILNEEKNLIEIIQDERIYEQLYTEQDTVDSVVEFLIDKYSENNTDTQSILIEAIRMLFQR